MRLAGEPIAGMLTLGNDRERTFVGMTFTWSLARAKCPLYTLPRDIIECLVTLQWTVICKPTLHVTLIRLRKCVHNWFHTSTSSLKMSPKSSIVVGQQLLFPTLPSHIAYNTFSNLVIYRIEITLFYTIPSFHTTQVTYRKCNTHQHCSPIKSQSPNTGFRAEPPSQILL